jgi:hypothetical protein
VSQQDPNQPHPPPYQPELPPHEPYPPQQMPYQPQHVPYPYAVPPVPPKKNNCLMFALIGVGVVIVLVIIFSLTSKPAATPGTTAATPVAGSTPAATVPPAATLAPAPSYQKIAAQKSALTAAQLDVYIKSLAGAHVDNWTGTTLDVSTKIFSTDVYQIQVDMTGPTDNPFKNAQVYVDITKDQSLAVSKGKSITFSGTIDHVDCTLICTVEVKDATYTVK